MYGTPFGRYRFIELLGEGGMGEVWRAHDTVTDRVVAIKVLPAKLSKDEEFQRRFRREAHAAARLNTPHVVPIYDYGDIDDQLFVCMRLIEGRDLAAVLADGPLEPARAARIIGQVAEALDAAHGIGLIHRDIKPSNILLDDRDFAYLIDFGIARVADDTRMTKTGSTIGTFAYIAPERLDLQGEEDARVDIYSLACVLFECLTGEPPFAADTMPRLMMAHLHSPPPRPSIARPDVPPAVDEVIATGMAKDPDRRYATTIELADAAGEAVTVPPARPTPTPPQPPTEEAVSSRAVPATAQARNVFIAEPSQVDPESPGLSGPTTLPRSALPIPARTGGSSRRTAIALIAGFTAAILVVIVGTIVWNRSSNGPYERLDRRLDEVASSTISLIGNSHEMPQLPKSGDTVITARQDGLVESNSSTVVLPRLPYGYADTSINGVRYRVRTVVTEASQSVQPVTTPPMEVWVAVGAPKDAATAEQESLLKRIIAFSLLGIGAVALLGWAVAKFPRRPSKQMSV